MAIIACWELQKKNVLVVHGSDPSMNLFCEKKTEKKLRFMHKTHFQADLMVEKGTNFGAEVQTDFSKDEPELD